MQKEVKMPALSSTMKEGKIVAWSKKVGDKVSSGDVLLVVESDKADMDVESFEDGYLSVILTPEGGVAEVGAVVAVIVDSVNDVGKSQSSSPVATSGSTSTKAAPSEPSSSAAKPKFDEIFMPALSSTMKEGKIVAWSKKVGDKVSSGDVLLVVESDKADMDVESFEEGFLASILVKDGNSAAVGAPVAVLVKSAAEIPTVQAYFASGGSGGGGGNAKATSSETASSTQSSAPASSAPSSGGSSDGRVAASGYAQSVAKQQGIDLNQVTPSRNDGFITAADLSNQGGKIAASNTNSHVPAPGVINASPMARKLASENNLDLNKIKGTGNFGRVTPDDVLIAAGKKSPTPPPAAPSLSSKAEASSPKSAAPAAVAVKDEIKVMDGMRKAVSKNMEKSLVVPVFRVSREIVTDNFDALYAQLKPKGVSVSAMLAKAVAEVLKKYPIINAAYTEQNGAPAIKFNKDINVAMAVAIDGGLITPTIIKASELDLFSIARNWKDLVEKAKAKKLTPAEYGSGTFTISNLGMYGVSQFDAILPPNTGSILAISSSLPKVVQLKNGHFGVQKSMTVTLTCDHRHIYGADVAEFLRDLADLLENNVNSLTMG